MIDCQEFIVTGVLGQIRLGASEEDVIGCFGEPDIRTCARRSYPAMLVYGDLEFRFRSHRLTVISLCLRESGEELRKSVPLENVPRGDAGKLEAIQNLLRKNQVEFSIDPIMTDETQTVLVTNASVHLAFSRDGDVSKVAAVRGMDCGKGSNDQ